MVGPKSPDLKHLLIPKLDNCSVFLAHESFFACVSGIYWPQPNLSLHSCLKRSFARRIQGATRPRRLYIDIATERIPLLVCLSCTFMPNLNAYVFVHQRFPKPLSIGRLLLLKFKSLTSFVHSIYGNDDRISLLLMTHFVKGNLPMKQTDIGLYDNFIAASSEATDFKQSSI